MHTGYHDHCGLSGVLSSLCFHMSALTHHFSVQLACAPTSTNPQWPWSEINQNRKVMSVFLGLDLQDLK
jgi:hypothetical protein